MGEWICLGEEEEWIDEMDFANVVVKCLGASAIFERVKDDWQWIGRFEKRWRSCDALEDGEFIIGCLVVFCCKRYKSMSRSSRFNFDRSIVWIWWSNVSVSLVFDVKGELEWSIETWIGTRTTYRFRI